MTSFLRIFFMIVIIVWAIMLTIHAHGQAIDAPSAVRRPHEVVGCGPKWMGGCYVYGQSRTNMETIANPYFLWPTVADGIFTSLDAAVTVYGLSHSQCEESNTDLGRHPSNLKIAGVNALIFGVSTGFRFAAIKVIPENSKSKLAWIPRAFSVGSAVRSGVVHVRGVRSWFTEGCI